MRFLILLLAMMMACDDCDHDIFVGEEWLPEEME